MAPTPDGVGELSGGRVSQPVAEAHDLPCADPTPLLAARWEQPGADGSGRRQRAESSAVGVLPLEQGRATAVEPTRLLRSAVPTGALMTVVVGYVPTPEGRAAVLQAGEEALLRRARLLVLNVSRGAAPGDPALATPAEIADLTAQLRGAGVEHEIRQSPQGAEVAEQLLGAAAEPDVRLLVIGLRRRTAVGKLLLGSSAQRVLLQARCPVLAVHADDEA